MCSNGQKGSQVEKRRPGIKWQKKGRNSFRALCAISLLLGASVSGRHAIDGIRGESLLENS